MRETQVKQVQHLFHPGLAIAQVYLPELQLQDSIDSLAKVRGDCAERVHVSPTRMAAYWKVASESFHVGSLVIGELCVCG